MQQTRLIIKVTEEKTQMGLPMWIIETDRGVGFSFVDISEAEHKFCLLDVKQTGSISIFTLKSIIKMEAHELKAKALEAAVNYTAAFIVNADGDTKKKISPAVVIKNAETFLEWLTKQ